MFCLKSGRCELQENCEVLPPLPLAPTCLPHEEICLQLGSCVPKGRCGSPTVTPPPASLSCPPFQVFCLASSSCTPVGKCERSDPPPTPYMCPPDEEFCLQLGACTRQGTCGGPKPQLPTKVMSCSPGEVCSVSCYVTLSQCRFSLLSLHEYCKIAPY